MLARRDLVLSSPLGRLTARSTLRLRPPGRLPPCEWNTTTPVKNGLWAPFYSYLSRHRFPNGLEHQRELGFTAPLLICRVAWFPKDKEGFSDLYKQTKHICGYPGNKPSLKLL